MQQITSYRDAGPNARAGRVWVCGAGGTSAQTTGAGRMPAPQTHNGPVTGSGLAGGEELGDEAVELVGPLQVGQVAGLLDHHPPGAGDPRLDRPAVGMHVGDVRLADEDERRHLDLAEPAH